MQAPVSVARRRRVRGPAAIAAAVLLLAACGSTQGPRYDGSVAASSVVLDEFARANDLAGLPRARVTVGEGDGALVVDVLVAGTASARSRGLQGVTEVPDGVGMLFAFDGPPGPGGRPGFWMLDTLVSLDIAFAADGAVVGVAMMTPCAARPCPVTHPGVAYDVALEVAAGVLADAGIAPGDPARMGSRSDAGR
jgi:uncharacterized membrane protein (UPF0127 family)